MKMRRSSKWVPLPVVAASIASVLGSVCYASVEPELTMAVRQKNVPQVQLLLSEGANVNERDEGEEQTPLMCAVQVNHPSLVQILLAHGAAINSQDDAGKTALMFAAEKNEIEIARILLNRGANISICNRQGATAMTMAKEKGYTAFVTLLRETQQRHNQPHQQARIKYHAAIASMR